MESPLFITKYSLKSKAIFFDSLETKHNTMKAITCFVVALAVLQHVGTVYGQLNFYFYTYTCPNLENIVFNTVRSAVMNDTRMAASLLRLHFHDCFVNGCDGSVLLDDTDSIIGEKTAGPNLNSARGFEVIDDIKKAVENSCNNTVSCTDILSLAARDSVYLSGGPYWTVSLGRRDGKTASKSTANANIPSPFESLDSIINKFQAVGLSVQDVVVLSGAHSIGFAHCNTFSSRLFNFNTTSSSDPTIQVSFLADLKTQCPNGSSDPNKLVSLDSATPNIFDNAYFKNLQNNKGLLLSDQALFSTPNASTAFYVNYYSNYPYAFTMDFRVSMMKLANVSVLTGSAGEIRKNCRFVN